VAVPAGAALACALLLASCSSGGSPTTTTTTTSTTGSTTSTTGSSTSTTTTTSATTTSTAAGVSTCQPSQLQVVPQQGTGAAGTIYETINLTNASSGSCTLKGYPGMQLLNAQGGNIPTTVVRGGMQFPAPAANQPPALITLASQQTATFALSYEDVPVGNETSCPMSAKAQITPPTDFSFVTVTLAIGPCGNGTVHVSPVYLA
jgi:hypothetical protein